MDYQVGQILHVTDGKEGAALLEQLQGSGIGSFQADAGTQPDGYGITAVAKKPVIARQQIRSAVYGQSLLVNALFQIRIRQRDLGRGVPVEGLRAGAAKCGPGATRIGPRR